MAYGLTRWLMARLLSWQTPDSNLMTPSFKWGFSFAQLAIWITYEGGWILVGAAAWELTRIPMSKGRLLLFLGAVVLSCLTGLVVLDTSRVAAFSFPLLLAALAILSRSLTRGELRRMLMWAAGLTVLAPNFEVIIGMAVKWLPPYVVVLLHTP